MDSHICINAWPLGTLGVTIKEMGNVAIVTDVLKMSIDTLEFQFPMAGVRFLATCEEDTNYGESLF